MDKWKCLKLQGKYRLTGSYNSNLFVENHFLVYPCKNSSANDNKCAPQQEIDEILKNKTNFFFTYTFIDPNINANEVDHIQFHLNANNYVIFSN